LDGQRIEQGKPQEGQSTSASQAPAAGFNTVLAKQAPQQRWFQPHNGDVLGAERHLAAPLLI
jgi:hypothetical protein